MIVCRADHLVVSLFRLNEGRRMDQEKQTSELQQMKDLLVEMLRLQELILQRLAKLEEAISEKSA
jgi:hypothetical protein